MSALSDLKDAVATLTTNIAELAGDVKDGTDEIAALVAQLAANPDPTIADLANQIGTQAAAVKSAGDAIKAAAEAAKTPPAA